MWTPPLTDLQRRFYLNEQRKRYRCIYGARNSGKTITVHHTWMKHGWYHEARVAFITKTNRQGSYGIWPKFCGDIFNIWKSAGIGSEHADFGWRREPWRDSITKIEQCQIYNRHGGVSTFVLFPIEDAKDARDKLLSTEWSGVWISEGHMYRGNTPEEMTENRQILDTAILQLRFDPCPFEERMVIVDTNPPDEGPDHWLYPPFFSELEWASNNEWPDGFTPEQVEAKRMTAKYFDCTCMPLESNTFLKPEQKAVIINAYSHDPFIYARYVESKWIAGSTKGVFGSAFRQDKHIIGKADAPDELDWEVIPPSNAANVHVENGRPLIIAGWDMGDVNHACVFIQPFYVGNTVHFRVLDEVVVLKEEMTLEEFTQAVMEKMDALEEFAGFELSWQHFSDSSAFEFRAAISRKDLPEDSDMTDAAIVYRESDGKIMLEGSANVKKPGWVRRRVAFVAGLLKKPRIVVSANCKQVIAMFRGLKKGERRGEAVALGQPNKHAWDALSYALSMFALEEVMGGKQTADTQTRSSVVHA